MIAALVNWLRGHESGHVRVAKRLGLSVEDVKRAEDTIRELSKGVHPIDANDLESILTWRIAHGGKGWAIGGREFE